MEPAALNAIRLLGACVARDYPACTGLLLFGSHANGTAGAFSDVDACVLLPRVERPCQVVRELGGRELDLHIYDFDALLQAMHRQRRNRIAYIAQWLCTGIVLKDEGAALQRARAAALEILGAAQAPFDWSSHEASITNLVRALHGCVHGHARISCLNALYRLTTHGILLRHGRWLQGPKDLVAELERLDAALCTRLHDSYRDAILGTPAAFVCVVEAELEAVRDLLHATRPRCVA